MIRALCLLLPLLASAQEFVITQTSLPKLPSTTKYGNSFQVLADTDTIAPTVSRFSFTPTVLDFSKLNTQRQISITLEVSDNPKGSGVVLVYVAFAEPSGNNSYIAGCNLVFPFTTPSANGTWTCTLDVPNQLKSPFPAAGTWNLRNITAVDLVGNIADYSQGKAQQSGFPNTFTVIIPSATTLVDVSFATSEVDVKLADNALQFKLVPFNCTTSVPPLDAIAPGCSVFFECADGVWADGFGSPFPYTSTTFFTGTVRISDWAYFNGQCTLQGVVTTYEGPSGGEIVGLYGTADPVTMDELFPPNTAPALIASPFLLVLSIAAALFLSK